MVSKIVRVDVYLDDVPRVEARQAERFEITGNRVRVWLDNGDICEWDFMDCDIEYSVLVSTFVWFKNDEGMYYHPSILEVNS